MILIDSADCLIIINNCYLPHFLDQREIFIFFIMYESYSFYYLTQKNIKET